MGANGCFYLVIVFFIFLTVSSNYSWGLNRGTSFMNSLLNPTTYDRRLRPYHRTSPLNVTVGMTVVSFGDVEEIRSEFSLDIFLRQLWSDPRLRHTGKYPIILSGKDRHLIWLPDTYFLNIRTAKLHNVPADNSRVLIFTDGRVEYSTRITLTAGCEMELHNYPLDTQICNLRIMSYANPLNDLDYAWKNNSMTGLDLMNDNMAQLEVTKTEKLRHVTKLANERYAELVARFVFRRRLGYSLLQVYAPTFLIVALSWFSFWISKDAISARVALGVTTVLTIVTLNGSFRSSVPKVSYIKALDWYLIVSFIFVFGAVIEYVAVLLYVDYKDHKNYSQQFKGSNFVKTPPEETTASDQDNHKNITITGDSSGNQEDVTSDNDQEVIPVLLDNAKSAVNEILSVNSTPIDKMSKILFPASYILFNVVYWLAYGP